jgi:DNA-binding transcriptional ArsR family regulator
MSSSNQTPAYLKLLNLISAIRELSPLQNLSADEEKILSDLAVRWHFSEKVTVGEMMQDSERVSPSTMYRRLIALRDKGLVSLPADKADRRIKFVIPTNAAKNYIKKLDEGMKNLMKEQLKD